MDNVNKYYVGYCYKVIYISIFTGYSQTGAQFSWLKQEAENRKKMKADDENGLTIFERMFAMLLWLFFLLLLEPWG